MRAERMHRTRMTSGKRIGRDVKMDLLEKLDALEDALGSMKLAHDTLEDAEAFDLAKEVTEAMESVGERIERMSEIAAQRAMKEEAWMNRAYEREVS